MGSVSIATSALFIILSVAPAFATDYTVGDSQGWTTGTDYSSWASANAFNVGDTLLFQYGFLHSVSEVSKSDYDACSSTNSIQSYNDQNTKITLTAPGTRYFICGTAGHCTGGMKLAVAVSGSGPTSPSATSSPTDSAPNPVLTPNPVSTGGTRTSSPAVPQVKNAASGFGVGGNAVLIGGLIVGLALLG